MIFQTAIQSLNLTHEEAINFLINNKDKIEEDFKEVFSKEIIHHLRISKTKEFSFSQTEKEKHKFDPFFPISFHGEHHSFEGKSKKYIQFNTEDSDSIAIDFLISFFDSSSDEKIYNEFFPSMPMIINPIMLFQLPNNVLRIMASNLFDCSVDTP